MALSTVKEVLLRASTDGEFRKVFFEDKKTALSAYGLSKEEKKCLMEIKDEARLEGVIMKIQTKVATCASDIRR